MAKKKHEEHENHERWLVSYADFITLLFAFFVVMYSVSSVNEGKYRTVSDSIKAALNPVNSIPSSRLPLQHRRHETKNDSAGTRQYQ
jgi:chemotaxis protein MotB